MPSAEELLEQFIAARTRGEDPDPRDYVARAGADAEALVEMLDAYLETAPTQEPSPEVRRMVERWAEGEPTLLTLRTGRGRRVGEVAQAIVERFGFSPGKAGRVRERYQELESGLIDPAGVEDGVFAAIADALEVPVSRLAVWRGRDYRAPEITAPAFRVPDAEMTVEQHRLMGEVRRRSSRQADEVDRIFGVGE